jgi:hypothetical protein
VNWDPQPVRRLFKYDELLARGHTRGDLRYGKDHELFTRVIHGVYAEGRQDATPFDEALARMFRDDTPAWGLVAGRLYDLDAVRDVEVPPVKRRRVTDIGGEPRHVRGVLCASPLQTIIDLATILGDDRWEQANESALHKHLFTIEDEMALLAELSSRRTPGVARMRRVLACALTVQRPPRAGSKRLPFRSRVERRACPNRPGK